MSNVVKKEVFDEGIGLGHTDAQIIEKAVEEGWIATEDAPKTAASAAERLADDENISLTDAKTFS